MPKITFTPELHHRQNQKGLHAILIRMTQNRKHKRKELGFDIEKRHWNINKKQVRSSHPLHAVINAAIKSEIQKLESEYLKTIPLKHHATMEQISNKATDDILSKSFTKYFKDYINELKNGNTANSMSSAYNKLCRYKSDVTFDELDLKFIANYKEHLKKVLLNNDTTIALDLSYLRLVYNKALKAGFYEPAGISPFWNMTLKKAKYTRTKLSTEQIEQIQNLNLSKESEAINHARNIFLICYYLLGIRVSSMITMRWTNIKGNRCMYSAAKGEKKMDVIINKKAQDILEQYLKPDSQPTDFIFPFLEPNTILEHDSPAFALLMKIKVKRINIHLSKISKILGIELKISTHVARSSFAYNARKISNNDIYAVQKALGHSSISTTERYFSSDETIEADNLSGLMFD